MPGAGGARAQAIHDARDGGSVPPATLEGLRRAQSSGDVHIHEHARVVTGTAAADRPVLTLDDGTEIGSHRVWLATGTEPSVHACPLLDDIVAHHPCDQHHGLPDLRPDLSWPGTRVHLSGRLAGLQLGPAAGNLWGARRAANRILELEPVS